MLVADNQQREDVVENIGGNLLLGIAPRLVRIAVTLNNQAIETKVHSLLTQRSNQFTTSTNVGGVADDGQFRNATMQLDGNLPHRSIAVYLLLEAGETTMDGTQALDTSLVQALHSTNPELEIRIDRVLYEHRDVNTLQGIGQSLHGKRIGSGAGTNPQDVHIVFQGQLDMLGGSHLCRDEHVGFVLHLLHPGQGFLAITLEASWLGTGLPHTSTEVMTAFHSQLARCVHHLLLSLSTAGTCNDEGAFVVTR